MNNVENVEVRLAERSRAQRRVEDFCQSNGLNAELHARILDLTSEVGELAKEWLRGTKYGSERLRSEDVDLTELGDVYFCLLSVANALNVSLEACLELALKKYSRRVDVAGTVGSEADSVSKEVSRD